MKTLGVQPRLSILDERLAICRLDVASGIPPWGISSRFASFTRTADELSVVCPEESVPEDVGCERGWRVLKLEGPLDFSLVGVLAKITGALAEADVSVFVISTFDTDYVLVRENLLNTAVTILRDAGYEVQNARSRVLVRPADAGDEPFLWEMLYEAAHWSPEKTGSKPPSEKLLAEPGLRNYLAGWGRVGDFALIARDVENGRKVGAAWYRIFPASDPGYGFVDEATPDIVIAVVPDRRGAGVGRALLRALIDAAESNGFESLSLSVQKANHVARTVYERNGFYDLRDDGNAWVMKAELSAAD